MAKNENRRRTNSFLRFISALETHREQLGMAKGEFARHIGMSESQFSQFIAGANETRTDKMQAICDKLGFCDCFELVENSEVSAFSA